jgi:site-specific DNA recombinase
MNSEARSIIRCAIYTRKSSEEGLDMSFNSLDAQREACQAYILSQRQEGWRALPTRYDDGGFSGANMERPALKHLLEDIESGKIDTIVVYKVDRLTRSLADFAKIVEALDARGVSFVSITQQFNTTTSMGRLTLNVLLSFAQFEREVTGERIRDKIAASKRKGMWMGGNVPLGYELKERKLLVDPEEAKLIREVFNLYLELGCVSKLKARLDREGIKSKVRTSAVGVRSGGVQYSRGALYQILKNRIYLGQISHKGQNHLGQHKAIVPQELWDRVQVQLRSDNQGRRNGLRACSSSLLVGLLQDADGNRFTPSHTVKNGKRYRYYVSQSVIRDSSGAHLGPTRLPAHEIETRVLSRLRSFLQSDNEVADQVGILEDRPETIQQLVTAARNISASWKAETPGEINKLVRRVITRVRVHPNKIEVVVDKNALRQALVKDCPATSCPHESGPEREARHDLLHLEFAATIKRRGGEVRLVLQPGSVGEMWIRHSAPLLKAIARAHDWHDRIIKGRAWGPRSLAQQTGLDESYVHRIFNYAFLAPDIIEAILDGRQADDLTLEKLRKRLPMSWAEQRKALPTR